MSDHAPPGGPDAGVRAPAAIAIEPADPLAADVRWCFERYLAELDARFETGFDAGRSLPADPADLVPPRGLVLLARLDDRPVGCGALKLHGVIAEMKRMWVAPEARGQGIGGRLLGALEQHARGAGATVGRLETNRALGEAVALYRRAGWQEVPAFSDEPYAHHWFEKRLR